MDFEFIEPKIALKHCDFPDSGVCFGNHANKKAGDGERAVRRSRRPLVCDYPNLQSNVAVLKNQTQGTKAIEK